MSGASVHTGARNGKPMCAMIATVDTPGNAGRRALACALLSCIAWSATARGPQDAPPLPPPGPGFTIINVDTAQELADACWNLTSNRAIVIAPGDYDLASVVFPNGQDGRLTVGRFGSPAISNIQIRGATGNPADVRLHGDGMVEPDFTDPDVPSGFQIFTATDVTIAELSVDRVHFHAVQISGEQGADRIRLYHVRLFDTGQQIVKGTTGGDDVTIEYSELFYTAGAAIHPQGSPPNTCYTNAVDGFGADRWIVRDNLIRGIRCQDGALAGPAVLLWAGSADTIVERNTILDSSRGISLGLGEGDHTGGRVRNNFIRWNPSAAYAVDVPIYTTSPNARVLHNTALTAGRYPNAIEVRYATATGVEVRNNVLDAIVLPRNGATPTLSGNLTNAQNAWFVDAAAGNLHLTAAAVPALNAATRLSEAQDDFDAVARPSGAGETDLGADELGGSTLIFANGFE